MVALCLVAVLASAPAAFAQGLEVTVEMGDDSFAPANATVEPGTTVTRVQSGENPHATASYAGLWDSGMIAGGSGESSSFTFGEPGTYDCFCIPHGQVGMPDTGGPSLLMPLSAALLACGLVGLAVLRRRLS